MRIGCVSRISLDAKYEGHSSTDLASLLTLWCDPDGKRGFLEGFFRATFSVVWTSWLLCLVCVTTLTVFCKGMENSVLGAMNV